MTRIMFVQNDKKRGLLRFARNNGERGRLEGKVLAKTNRKIPLVFPLFVKGGRLHGMPYLYGPYDE